MSVSFYFLCHLHEQFHIHILTEVTDFLDVFFFQCLVYFKVHLLNRNKSRQLRLLFQEVISLDSLRSGW